jgi:pSer/pThr/pTyr-binding forkhead associated (FHA) protein
MPIGEAVVTIGRSLDNDIVLDDEHVSRCHAQLRRRYGQYVLYDLGSGGGTTVNGRPVREAPLRHGDVIRFAGVEMRFEQTDAADAVPSPPSPRVTRPMPRPHTGKNQP